MASARAPAVRSDIVSSLPLELATSVLLRVDLEDLLACSAVCRSWRSLARLECLYVPYLQRKHARPASGRSATALAPAASVRSQLLERYRGLSASSYFSSCETLRDLALRHLRLQKQWATGVPTRKFGLLAEGGQDARLLSVVVDPLWDLVITGGVDGTVRFWCTKTRRPVDTAHARGLVELARPGIAAMALEGDYLVAGDNTSLVHILERDHPTRTFKRAASFPVTSAVFSIHLSGHTVISACARGEIDFRSVLSPSTVLLRVHTPFYHHLGQRNLSIHYARPFLFTSSKCVSQISPRTVDPDNRRELWEYSENELRIKNYSVPESAEGQEGACIVAPFRRQGELLVAWPDASVYSLTGFKASIVALPECHLLAERTHPRYVRSLAVGDSVFVTSSYGHESAISIFTHHGQRLQTFVGREEITGLAMDPTFFVSVSKDRGAVLWDFAPPTLECCASHSPEPSVFSDVDADGEAGGRACETPPSSPDDGAGAVDWAPAGGARKRKATGEGEQEGDGSGSKRSRV